jgi:hypothetical protein
LVHSFKLPDSKFQGLRQNEPSLHKGLMPRLKTLKRETLIFERLTPIVYQEWAGKSKPELLASVKIKASRLQPPGIGGRVRRPPRAAAGEALSQLATHPLVSWML